MVQQQQLHYNWVQNLAYFFRIALHVVVFDQGVCCLEFQKEVVKVISVTDIFPVEQNGVLDNWISETKSSGFFVCLEALLEDNLLEEKKLSWKIYGKRGSRLSSHHLKYSFCSLICIDIWKCWNQGARRQKLHTESEDVDHFNGIMKSWWRDPAPLWNSGDLLLEK